MTKEIQIREVRIGSGQPKICVPMTGKDRSALLEEAGRIRDIKADLAEWRADFYEGLSHEESLPDMLREIRNALGEIPLIFTIRTVSEGGNAEISEKEYEKYTLTAAESGNADLIDIEYFSHENVSELIRRIQMTGAKVIASTHDFEKTDDSKTLKNRFIDMDASGADILKMAVMPQRFEDVADLMQVTSEVTEEYTEKPVIAMSMGNLGSMSRICRRKFRFFRNLCHSRKGVCAGTVSGGRASDDDECFSQKERRGLIRIISAYVEPQREIMGICFPVLTNYAPPVTYNELTYQSEGMTGHRGLFYVWRNIHRCCLCDESSDGLYCSADYRKTSETQDKPVEISGRRRGGSFFFLPDSISSF